MANTKGKGGTVREYVASLEPGRRKEFQQLRELVSKHLPSARLTMAYSMPTWEINGPVIAAASQKSYIALYCLTKNVLDPNREAFSHLDVGKSCIRFRRMDDLPLPAVKKLLRAAEKEARARPAP